MNILTDILSLFKRKQVVEELTSEDLIVVGRHEKPDMLGVASPIPYKSVKLVKAKDLKVTSVPCTHINLDNGAPSSGRAGIYINTTSNPCSVNLRSISVTGNNIDLVQNNNEIEISTTGEPNTGVNVGGAREIYKDKVGETLRFRTITADDGSIGVTQNADTIDLSISRVLLTAPGGGVWEVTVDDGGQLITTAIS